MKYTKVSMIISTMDFYITLYVIKKTMSQPLDGLSPKVSIQKRNLLPEQKILVIRMTRTHKQDRRNSKYFVEMMILSNSSSDLMNITVPDFLTQSMNLFLLID